MLLDYEILPVATLRTPKLATTRPPACRSSARLQHDDTHGFHSFFGDLYFEITKLRFLLGNVFTWALTVILLITTTVINCVLLVTARVLKIETGHRRLGQKNNQNMAVCVHAVVHTPNCAPVQSYVARRSKRPLPASYIGFSLRQKRFGRRKTTAVQSPAAGQREIWTK